MRHILQIQEFHQVKWVQFSFFFPAREGHLIKFRVKINPIVFHLFNYGKGGSSSRQPRVPLRVEIDYILSFHR